MASDYFKNIENNFTVKPECKVLYQDSKKEEEEPKVEEKPVEEVRKTKRDRLTERELNSYIHGFINTIPMPMLYYHPESCSDEDETDDVGGFRNKIYKGLRYLGYKINE